MELFTSNSMLMLEKSMDFLWTKQESLRDKLESAASSNQPKQAILQVLEDTDFAVTEPQESTRMDDNGVNITEQSTELVRNSYQLQYVMNAISADMTALRTAAKG